MRNQTYPNLKSFEGELPLQTELNWTVGWSDSLDGEPVKFVPAVIPGAVQLDWARAENWPPCWFGENYREYGWMEDRFWIYRTCLPEMSLPEDGRLFFVSRGIDYQFEIRFDGRVLHAQEGMFTPVEVELPQSCRGGETLEVRVYPAPKSQTHTPDRSQANRSCKPAVSYGWDFHPRLIPLGIWDETRLEVRSLSRLTRCEISYRLSADLKNAKVSLELGADVLSDRRIRWHLLDPAGIAVLEREFTPAHPANAWNEEAELAEVELWWPHDQGEPKLYSSTVEVRNSSGAVCERVTQRIGFRRVRLVMNEGAWQKPDSFPKSRSVPPITLEINGRAVFGKGSNWVNPSIFPGTITRDTYQPLITLAKQANFNLLRCWGGAIVNKESFFELCDEAGIMVWQEFPLACNVYPDDEEYLKVLDQESRSIISRLKKHPSLVLWCGGNELFNSWSRMTDQSLPLRLLNRNCYDLDPERPFLPTSPVMGMAHGHYTFRDPLNGEEACAIFQKSDATAYTEFGCAGPASIEVLRQIIPEEDLFPPRPGTSWETHHAFRVWMEASHLYLPVIEHYCGVSHTLEELVANGQLLQGEGYKALFEEARRQKPYSSMALNWCFNEPWPTAANNSLLSWPAVPKLAYSAVAASCRSVLASARIRKFEWVEGEVFDPEVWILSDAPESLKGGEMQVTVKARDIEIELLRWSFGPVEPNRNRLGPRAQFILPAWEVGRFTLSLKCAAQPEWDSEYTLFYRRKVVSKLQGGGLNF